MLLGTVTQAQDYYRSLSYEQVSYDFANEEYGFRESKLEDTRFITHREYLALETSPGSFIKISSAYSHNDRKLGDCYIMSSDKDMYCLDSEDNKVWIFLDFQEEEELFKSAVVLTDIEKIEPFKITWK